MLQCARNIIYIVNMFYYFLSFSFYILLCVFNEFIVFFIYCTVRIGIATLKEGGDYYFLRYFLRQHYSLPYCLILTYKCCKLHRSPRTTRNMRTADILWAHSSFPCFMRNNFNYKLCISTFK